MKENSENPLNLEDKLYTVEEFAYIINEKFGNNNNVSDIFLTEMFLAKYPIYSCKIKKSEQHISQENCSCC
tara:strand:+ start:112 stop:324 length:213 start_codon:yes stop_codon:yes gene_type:complete